MIRNLFIVAATFALTACASTSASPSNDASAVVEAKFAAVNRHDIAGILALYAPDAEIMASDFCAPRHGHADVERIYRGIFAAIPDAVADVESYVAEGDRRRPLCCARPFRQHGRRHPDHEFLHRRKWPDHAGRWYL